MARGVNKVILIGNLGSDPEVRQMPNGNAVANVTLATSDTWKDKNTGQQQERTEWHRIVFFGRLAEVVGQYLKKGSKIYVEGRLQTREWEKDGVKRYTTEIVVDIGGQMQMLDGRDGGAQQGHSQPARAQAPQQQNTQHQGHTQPQNQNYTQGHQPAQQQRPAPAAQMPPPPATGQAFENFSDDIPF